jgi:hypothetical protein
MPPGGEVYRTILAAVNRLDEFYMPSFGTTAYDGVRLLRGIAFDRMWRGPGTAFTPALRAQLMQKFRGLETPDCSFVNLPEKRSGRWGQGLTASKMKDCRWLKPVLVGQFEFREWTPDDHLRHSRFVALREDKKATSVHRELARPE